MEGYKLAQGQRREVIHIHDKKSVLVTDRLSCRADRSELHVLPYRSQMRFEAPGEGTAAGFNVVTDSLLVDVGRDGDVPETLPQERVQVSFDERSSAHRHERFVKRAGRGSHPFGASAGHDKRGTISSDGHRSGSPR